jgi:hypothetical protein
MDRAVRVGKVVYSQACWLLDLNDLSSLLTELGMYKYAAKLRQMTDEAIHGVEQKLWSEQMAAILIYRNLNIEIKNHTDY